MKYKILLLLLVVTSFAFAQNGDNYWTRTTATKATKGTTVLPRKEPLPDNTIFSLDVNALKSILAKVPKNDANSRFINSDIIVSFPNFDGVMEKFKVFETSNMNPILAAKYPDIKSYRGQGYDNPTAVINFSLSPLGLQTMVTDPGKPAIFIEPYSMTSNTYTIYKKSDKNPTLSRFQCDIIDTAKNSLSSKNLFLRNADDKKLRTYRLALSCTAEYANYFGVRLNDTKVLALAAMNNTMTRVNAIFERDFAVHLNLIANNEQIIYTNPISDPYDISPTNWNTELQNTLTTTIGNANYDIGHLFSKNGGGGNAGCIGCICIDPTLAKPKGKGSGYTSPGNGIPSGDSFDIDYVAHEMGHQLGANHTFTYYNKNENANVQMEPGSGSTIMGYAGIAGSDSDGNSYDCQKFSDPFFHAISIQQVTDNLKTKTCGVTTNLTTQSVLALAGIDRTIPRNTPFELDVTASTSLTNSYTWDQMDTGTSTTTIPESNNDSGPLFISYPPVVNDSKRYFPKISSVLDGTYGWKWEKLSNGVTRDLNFRLTVRNNSALSPQNNSDDIKITVTSAAGPFRVSPPNAFKDIAATDNQPVKMDYRPVNWNDNPNPFYLGAKCEIRWDVAGTNNNGVNCGYVDIDLLTSTDDGNTFTTETTLITRTVNNGSAKVIFPSSDFIANKRCRIRVSANDNIFFDISSKDFTIQSDVTKPLTPKVTTIRQPDASVNLDLLNLYDLVGVEKVEIYKNGLLLTTIKTTAAAPNTYHDVHTQTYEVTGLNKETGYEFYIIAIDKAGNRSDKSNNATFGKYPISYGKNSVTTSITNVKLQTNTTTTGGINYTMPVITPNNSGFQYQDFTTSGGTATMQLKRTSINTLTVTVPSTTNSKQCYVWIDYNQDGVFNDTNERVYVSNYSSSNPVFSTVNLKVTNDATLGDTRMRVSLKASTPTDILNLTSTQIFDNGIVQDYKITIVADTQAPSLAAVSEDTSALRMASNAPEITNNNSIVARTTDTSTDVKWGKSTDDVGVKKYSVYKKVATATSYDTNALIIEKAVTSDAADTDTFRKHQVSGLTEFTEYKFKVVAEDAAGNKSDFQECSLKTKDDIAPYFRISGISTANLTSYSATLGWNAASDDIKISNSGFDKYHVILKQGTTIIREDNIITTFVNHFNLKKNTKYSITVQAIDKAGNMSSDMTQEFTTKDDIDKKDNQNGNSNSCPPCAAAAAAGPLGGLTILAAFLATLLSSLFPDNNRLPDPNPPSNLHYYCPDRSTTIDTEAYLYWEWPSDEESSQGVTQFEVFKENSGVRGKIGSTRTVFYKIDNLTPGSTQNFSVRSLNYLDRWSDSYANVQVIIPDYHAPTAPANLVFSGTNAANTKLTWTASADNSLKAVTYNVYNGITKINSIPVTTISYELRNLISFTSYNFYVEAVDISGNKSAKTQITFIAPDTELPTVSNLSANGTSGNSTTLTWYATDNRLPAVVYDVYKSIGDSGFSVHASSVISKSCEIKGLTDASVYKFYIIARDAAGNTSAASNIAEVITPDKSKPTTPVSLDASGTEGTKTKLSWGISSDNVGVTGYEVYKNGIFLATVTATNYAVTGLTDAKTYSFYVLAIDAAGNKSNSSNVINVKTPDITIPLPPNSVKASNTGTDTTTLEWAASTDNVAVTGYDIYKNGTKINTTAITSLNYVVSGLTSASSYTFNIKAKDAAGNTSTSSANVQVKTTTAPPTNFKVDAQSYANLNVNNTFSSVLLSWTPPVSSGVLSYTLFYKRTAEGTYKSLAITATNSTYNLTTALCPLPMYYDLYLVCNSSTSGGSSVASNTILFNALPHVPTGLNASLIGTTTLTLKWDAPDANKKVRYWNVYKKKSTETSYTKLNTTNVTTNSYNVTGLDRNTEYKFKITAYDIFGNASDSTSDVATQSYCPPIAGAVSGSTSANASAGSMIKKVLLGAGGFNTVYTFNRVFWEDYTSISSNLSKTITNTLKVTVSATDPDANATMAAYIDYNNNGVFDVAEKINFGNLTTKNKSINVDINFVSDPIIIPASATNVPTRLRIIYQRNTSTTDYRIFPCEFRGRGEVLDFTVNIGSGNERIALVDDGISITTKNEREDSNLDSKQQVTVTLYPNPVSGDLLNITGVEDKSDYKILNNLGQEIAKGKIENGTINVSTLNQSTYFLEIINEDIRIIKQFIKQ